MRRSKCGDQNVTRADQNVTARVTAARRTPDGARSAAADDQRGAVAISLRAAGVRVARAPAGARGHGVREGGVAFGCLAELATRRGSPLRPVAPQEDLQSPPSSLPRRILVPAEHCCSKPPYSREWLLSHRARCGGSPLRPTALHLSI
eukprot:scaffold65753_cov35-Phaeocystis_antarctica.AAC.1